MKKIAYMLSVGMAASVLAFGTNQAAAADGPALVSDEITSLLVGRTLYMLDTGNGGGRGNTVRMFFDPSGEVRAVSTSGMSNSGPYTIKDGTLCNEWRDTRWRGPWCYTLHKDDDEVKFINTSVSPDRGQKWLMKSSKDGNSDRL